MKRRFYFCFLILLSLALFQVLRQKASLQPLLAQNGDEKANADVFGQLVAVSNRFAFFYVSLLYDDYNQAKVLQPVQFRILKFGSNATNKKDTKIRIYTPIGVPKACFVSENQIVLWNAGFVPGLEDVELTGQIFDCESLKTVERFDSVILKYNHIKRVISEGKGSPTKRGVVFLTKTEAYEWNLKTGGLLHRWKLEKAGEEPPTAMSYALKSDNFVQILYEGIRVWDAKTGKFLRETKNKLKGFNGDGGDESGASNVLISHNGEYVIYDSPCYDCDTGPLHMARCSDAKLLWTIPNGTGEYANEYNEDHVLNGVAFGPDDREIYIWNESIHKFKVHDVLTGKLVRELPGAPKMRRFYLTPKGDFIISVDDKEKIWRQRTK